MHKFEVNEYSEIVCPVCGGDHTHHDTITVYERRQDSETGLKVSVLGLTHTVSSDMEGNPSPRRSGIVIGMWCEYCLSRWNMSIYQHKGYTSVDVEVTGRYEPGGTPTEHLL